MMIGTHKECSFPFRTMLISSIPNSLFPFCLLFLCTRSTMELFLCTRST
nr:hypothetical protein Q903MT_gene6510 [Picea sitchensis]